MGKFATYLELMEPNLFTAKDPANAIAYKGDEEEDEKEKQLPFGMRSSHPTAAFPTMTPAPKKKLRNR